MTLHAKAERIKLLLFDVDGVLTDGTIVLHADGSESKPFHIRDGAGIVWAHRAGLVTGILSARLSTATTARAAQLGIRIVHQGVASKRAAYDQIVRAQGLEDADVAFMGDDLLDLPVLARAGLSAAPSDASADVRERVDWVSTFAGGRGAARDLVELVLRAQQRWAPIVEAHAAAD